MEPTPKVRSVSALGPLAVGPAAASAGVDDVMVRPGPGAAEVGS